MRARVTPAGIFAQMDDGETREAAAAALAYLAEMAPGLRGAEIATADGTVLARRGAPPLGGDGRVFTVSRDGLRAVVLTEPAAPPTLTELDLRAALRLVRSGF